MMTKQARSVLPRRRRGRGAVLATATIATMALSLPAAPGAHAGDGGLLGDVTGGVAGATQPVVQPAVEVVQSAVPQPVQGAVEPVVEDVVEPAVAQVEQAVTSVPGAGRATEPVVEAVHGLVPRRDDRDDEPVDEPAEAPARTPATERATEPAGDAGAGTVDPAGGSDHPSVAPQESGAGGGTGSDTVGGPRDGGAAGSTAAGPPRDERLPSRTGLCDELAPRPMALSAVGQHPDEPDADQALWNLTNDLMLSWMDGDMPGSVDVGPPRDEDGEAWALGPMGAEDMNLRADGRWGMVEVLKLVGLFGLLMMLAAGVAVVVARQTE